VVRDEHGNRGGGVACLRRTVGEQKDRRQHRDATLFEKLSAIHINLPYSRLFICLTSNIQMRADPLALRPRLSAVLVFVPEPGQHASSIVG